MKKQSYREGDVFPYSEKMDLERMIFIRDRNICLLKRELRKTQKTAHRALNALAVMAIERVEKGHSIE